MKNKISIVGTGPGDPRYLTREAAEVLDACDTIIGYQVYIDLLRGTYPDKEYLSTPMTQELQRCRMAYAKAAEGRQTALICGGDAGVYGLASLMLEIGEEYPEISVEIFPGITAATAGAALLGAPLTGDFAVISLSDRLTPWERIVRRLRSAAEADFVICIYNPASRSRPDHLKRACEILLDILPPERICAVAENIGREREQVCLYTLKELREVSVGMSAAVYIGNSLTREINGRMVTPRGYLQRE